MCLVFPSFNAQYFLDQLILIDIRTKVIITNNMASLLLTIDLFQYSVLLNLIATKVKHIPHVQCGNNDVLIRIRRRFIFKTKTKIT